MGPLSIVKELAFYSTLQVWCKEYFNTGLAKCTCFLQWLVLKLLPIFGAHKPLSKIIPLTLTTSQTMKAIDFAFHITGDW